MKYEPRLCQELAIDFAKRNPFCALWMDMGLGKTSSVLTVVNDFAQSFDIGRTLVVAPLRPAKMTWPTEFEKWDHLSGLSYKFIGGNPEQRIRALRGGEDVHIINYDNFRWLVDHIGTRSRWPYDTLILDESTKVKNHRTHRYRAVRKVRPFLSRLIELTGTPAPNGLMDLWSQVYLLDRGERLGRKITAFRDRWFRAEFQGNFVKYVAQDWALDEITELCRDICLSLKAEDYLDLPPQVNNWIKLELPSRLRAQYNELEEEMFLHLEDGTVEAMNAASLSSKCWQFANGALYVNGTKDWSEVHQLKLDAMDDIVEEAAGMPILVAYNFKSDLARLLKRFPQARVLDTKQSTIDDWNAGKIPMLLAHPQSAGHGLNLQEGSNILVFFSLTWNLEEYQQIIERIGPTRQYQAGLDRPTFVHHLMVRNTTDQLMKVRLATKRETQDILREAMKHRRQAA